MEKLELSKYALTDEERGDYMVYEVKHPNGRKEYVSREVFKYLEALNILTSNQLDLECFYKDFVENARSYEYYEATHYSCYGKGWLNKEEFNLLVEYLSTYQHQIVDKK